MIHFPSLNNIAILVSADYPLVSGSDLVFTVAVCEAMDGIGAASRKIRPKRMDCCSA